MNQGAKIGNSVQDAKLRSWMYQGFLFTTQDADKVTNNQRHVQYV